MSWDDILGHDEAKRLLQAHLASGEVPGAYLLVGPEGVGKRRLALTMARALNCAAATSRPCEECQPCRQIARGTHPDVHLLSPGGASEQIKIEDIRRLLSRVALRPFGARVQVAVLDGAERLTEEAANALLKALEEPSAFTRFLLITSRVSDCLPTIVSRCQLIRCGPLSPDALKRILVDTQGLEPRVADAVARRAGGSVSAAMDLAARWAQLAQVAARLAEEPSTTWIAAPLPETRQDVAQFLDGLMGWLRDVAVASQDPAWIVHRDHAEALGRQARAMDLDRCLRTVFELLALRESLEQFVSPRLVASLAREKWLSLLGSDPKATTPEFSRLGSDPNG